MTTECFDGENGWRGTTITSNGVASQAIILTHSDIDDIKERVRSKKYIKIYHHELEGKSDPSIRVQLLSIA